MKTYYRLNVEPARGDRRIRSDSFTKTITHTYDLMGNPLDTTYPGGRTVTHSYDDLERTEYIHSSQGGDGSNLLAAYDYLGAGRVERRTMAGNGTQLNYEFDAVGRVNATAHAITATSAVFDDRSYVWDKANNKTQRVEFVGSTPVKTYDYEYDSLNRLVRSTKTIGAFAPGTASNWTGAMTLDSASPDLATFQGGTPLQLDGTFTATFDPGTLQVFVTQTQGTRDEAEDYVAELEGYTATQIDALAPARPDQGTFDLYASALNGATRVYSNPVPITYGPHIVEYDLDGAGNRDALYTQFETAPETFTDLDEAAYTEDATAPDPADAQMNQYTTAPGDTNDRVYDQNGNLLATDLAVFRHDYLDRIHDMDDGTVVAAYLYDALGRRIEKTVDDGVTPVTTRYLHDGARVAEEWDVPSVGNPTLTASYVYGLYIDEVLTMRRDGVDYYYHADDMHNVVKLTDSTGAVLEAYDYSDYGLPEFFDAAGDKLTGTAYANPYLFTGRQWDEELGYYYYRNRYMDPEQGRFASRDPLGIWGDPLNLGNGYTYAASNPWSLVDPFGLAAGGNGNGVREDWGYAFPDPHDSRYSPYMRDLLLGQFHEALHDQIIWTANGIGIIPGPSGTLADAIVAIETGDCMIQVEGLGGEVIGEVIGGFRKFSRAQVAADAQKRGVRVPKIACFPAGTLVMLADGSAKLIETIREGDLVLADNTQEV